MTNREQKGIHRLINVDLAPFWKPLTRNWLLKILCVALAFAAWQGIRESTSFEVVVAEIPVTILAGEGRAVLDQSTDVVSVRFRGSRDEIRFISRDQISIEVTLEGQAGAMRETVKFSPRYIQAPSLAHAVRFYPPEITVTVDREVERALPVKAVLEGNLPEGVQLEKAICEPALVRVRGAEKRLLALEQLHTVPIRLDGRFNSFNTHVAVAANGETWVPSPDRVMVALSLVENLETLRIENNLVRPLLVSGDTRIVQIHPEKVTVILQGSPKQIEKMNTQDVYSYVDCSEMTELTEYEVPIHVDVPSGIKVKKVEPSVVKVTVKKM